MHKGACNLDRSWYDTNFEVSACYSTQASDSSDASCKTTSTNVASNTADTVEPAGPHDCRFSTYDMCGHVNLNLNLCPLIVEEGRLNGPDASQLRFAPPCNSLNTNTAASDRHWSSVRLLSAESADEEHDGSAAVDSLVEWNETVASGDAAGRRVDASSTSAPRRTTPQRGPARTPRRYAAACVVSTLLALLFAALFLLQWRLQLLPPPASESAFAGEGSKVATCLTPICVQTAAYILSAMNTSASPCEDFYEYSCGNWIRANPLNDDQQAVNLFNKLADNVDLKLHSVLSVRPLPAELPIVVNTKRFYQSCLNETVIDRRDIKPLSEALREFRWWQVVDAILRNDSTVADFPHLFLEDLIADILVYGSGAVLDAWVNPDDKNSDIHSIYLEQGELSFTNRDYYVQPQYSSLMSEYEKMISEVVLALSSCANCTNTTMSKKDAQTVARAIFKVEHMVASRSATQEERRENLKQYNNITITALMTNYPQFNWQRYFTRIFQSAGVTVTDQDLVVASGLKYIQKLMKDFDTVTRHEMAAYCIWRFIYPRLSFLGKRQRALSNEVTRILRGTVSEKSRWRSCLTYVNSLLPLIVARMFLEESHFDLVQRAEAIRMISDIKDAFIDALNVTEWMEEETRQSAIYKAKTMQDLIGFPDYIQNDTYIMELYVNLTLDDRFFENHVRLDRFNTLSMLRRLRTTVNRSLWSSSPTSVNAYYNSHRNQIMLPAGILQPPFYHVEFPKAINYGVIGMVIGHEITHGFDDKGRQYDERGNLRDWWRESDTKRFKDKAQCIINQYSSYVVPEANMPIRGTATQGENIADNGGLKNAWRAYMNWVAKHGEEQRLPGISLNNEQVFFVSFAQVWCENRRKESHASRLMSMKHSPNRYRVIGTVSNSHEFAKAFNCPTDSPMNPKNKCTVW